MGALVSAALLIGGLFANNEVLILSSGLYAIAAGIYYSKEK